MGKRREAHIHANPNFSRLFKAMWDAHNEENPTVFYEVAEHPVTGKLVLRQSGVVTRDTVRGDVPPTELTASEKVELRHQGPSALKERQNRARIVEALLASARNE